MISLGFLLYLNTNLKPIQMKRVFHVNLIVSNLDGSLVETTKMRIKDALEASSNFSNENKIVELEVNELTPLNLDHDGECIYIGCAECEHMETLDVDEQRHHLKTFKLEWLDNDGELERSLMTCEVCKAKFVQLWNYKDDEELEDIEWNYACTSNVVSTSFDYGTVMAKTREEAIEKARHKLTQELEEANKKLEGFATIEVDLDSLYVERND